MECKLWWLWHGKAVESELIDTLWNVNTINSGAGWIQKEELIDTLWNVNEF